MRPLLYHIVAMAQNRVIGKNNQLPWRFPADLKHFKELTLGSTVIMGRKTFESIARPLPGRENFVLSRTRSHAGDHLKFFTSLDEALEKVATPKAFVIGGAELYRETLDHMDGIYLTAVPGEYEGDARYPEIPGFFVEAGRKILQDNPKLEVIFYENKKAKK